MTDEDRLRADVAEVGRRIYARGLVGAAEGNVSVRLGHRLLMTPAGVCKGFLAPEQIVATDLDGHPEKGRPSTESAMHTAIYRRRPDVAAVVHAHPPTATACSVVGLRLDEPYVAEAVATLGCVSLVPYRSPGTPELAAAVAEAVASAETLLLANHGALTVGTDVFRAWERMETLEHVARVRLVVRLLGGGAPPLPPDEVERLIAQGVAAGYLPDRSN
jgi:L-fuculose-phosphate aldolase